MAREVQSYFTGLLTLRATAARPVGPVARAIAVAVVALMSVGNNAWAATGTWSGTTTGTWDINATNWTGVSGTPWDSSNGLTNTATFNLASLAATVSGTVYTNGITFTTGGSLTGGTINLAGTNPTISVGASQTATIGAALAGTAGLTKADTGTLVLSGTWSNATGPYSGNTVINAGILKFTGGNTSGAFGTPILGAMSGAGSLVIETGSNSFRVNGITVSGGVTLNSGSLELNANMSGGAFTINGGTIRARISARTISDTVTVGGDFGIDSNVATNFTNTVNFGGATRTIALVSGTTPSTISGKISNGGLTVSGSGAGLVLSNTGNDYAGGTTVSGSVLSFANGSLGTTGAITVNGGTLQWNGSNTQDISSRLTLQNSGTATLDTNGNNVTLASAFGSSTSSSLTKTGTGTLTLSAANTYTGVTTISNGKIALGNALALQNSAWDTTGATGTIGLNVTGYTTPTLGGLTGNVNLATGVTGYGSVTNLTLNPQAGSSVTYSGVIANGALGMTLTKTGAGTQVLSGANTYTGATSISGGTLVAGNVAALGGSLTAGVYISTASGAGTLQLSTDTSVNAHTIRSSSSNQGTIVSDRATAGAGITHVLGAAHLGGNTYNITKGTNVTSGTAVVSFASINVAGGAGSTTKLNPTTADLSVTGAVNIASSNGDKTLELGGTSQGSTISGVISNNSNDATGTLSLTKSGAGTWTLSNANSYTGTTTISGGTLAANAANALGGTTAISVTGGSLLVGTTSAGVINDSATVGLTGGTIGYASSLGVVSEGVGALTLSATSTLDFGASAGTNSHTWTFASIGGLGTGGTGNILNVWNWAGTPAAISGTSHLIATNFSGDLQNIKFYSDAGSAFLGTGMLIGNEIVAVPEPGTILAGALLLGGLAIAERRRLRRVLAAALRF